MEKHVRTLGADLRERRSRLTAALAHEMPAATLTSAPAGGLHLWLRLPPGVDDKALTAAARQRGVAVSAGSRYFATEPPAAHLRLGFAATADLTELDEGARRLGSVLRDLDPRQQ
ncbi:aminotransferase class I/II-fold pyridoxal phosphate-dependent enzyme [Streptomyces agglomeratus]|uniref:aminotransferase class I/II-fold pyridoxal phosphate-dependent enzyme n=1 Tax=Streptomyces agglomeratus TaxID=285458 RepID=UPI001F0AE70B|nr:aminotransferase class I/II-fold pyridoxal phosphate-dependent enzyme [Streptomyces agglomeratus]